MSLWGRWLRSQRSKNLRPGDRVVVPFTTARGRFFTRELWSLCDNSNPNAWMAEMAYGYSPLGFRLLAHARWLCGRTDGIRPRALCRYRADRNSHGLAGRASAFSDIFPTGYMAAEHCNIRRGDTVAVWGCGPVGQFAIRSAYMLGADQVIAIDRFPERLQLAKTGPSGRVLDYQEVDVSEALRELTGARTGCSLMP